MNQVAEMLSNGRTKSIVSHIGELAIKDKSVMLELMECLSSDDARLAELAAWPLYTIADKKPSNLLPHLSELINLLDREVHDAVIRAILRYFSCIDIPEEYEGEVYDKCFAFLAEPQFPVAIRVWAMTVCTNLASRFPELAFELIELLEAHIPHGTAGFKNRGQKMLKQLYRLRQE